MLYMQLHHTDYVMSHDKKRATEQFPLRESSPDRLSQRDEIEGCGL